MLEYIINRPIGFLHLIFAIVALFSGTMVLAIKKGTNKHRKIGYVYTISMVILNLTAFLIYRLFDGFGPFHAAAIISLITLLGGVIPIIIRRPKNWYKLHLTCMYWSVVGLYAAFVSELLTRIPETPFAGMVGIATAIIMLVAGVIFGSKKKFWLSKKFFDDISR